MKKRKMKYRLALKLDVERREDNKPGPNVALGWSMVRLAEPKPITGISQSMPDLAIAKQDEVELRIVDYAHESDMLDPMPRKVFEERLKAVLRGLPGKINLVRIPFDRGGYEEYRTAQNKPDNHETRSEWAQQK